MSDSDSRNYSLSIIIFVIGIVAVVASVAVSGIKQMSTIVIVCEALVLLCLVGLLIVAIRARKKIIAQQVERERHPYANVDKKAIENIFDMISEEEKKRDRLNAFASGMELKDIRAAERASQNTASQQESKPKEDKPPQETKKTEKPENPEKQSKPASPPANEDESEEDERVVVAVLDDNEEEEAPKKNKSDDQNTSEGDSGAQDDSVKKRSPEKSKKSSKGGPRGDHPPKKRPPGSRPNDPYVSRQQRPQRSGYGYYDEVYYNEYGEPVRRRRMPEYDPYYDDYYGSRGARDPYGRTYYNEYGEPVRRRQGEYYDPRDPRRRAAMQGDPRRRPQQMNGMPMPQGGKAASKQADAPTRKAIGPEAPVGMTPIKQRSNYGDDYIPVAIVDDDVDNNDYSRSSISSAAAKAQADERREKQRQQRQKQAQRAAMEEIDRDVPIILPDDEFDADEKYGVEPSPASRNQDTGRSANRNALPKEEYHSEYNDDEVIVIPAFDDDLSEEDNRPSAPPPRGGGQAAPQQRNAGGYQQQYANDDYDDEIEDEAIVVLPRDEGYESFIEEKRAEERKAERKAKGKTALTIVRIKHKKLYRNPRSGKRFRASVTTLTDYLNSYSNTFGRR